MKSSSFNLLYIVIFWISLQVIVFSVSALEKLVPRQDMRSYEYMIKQRILRRYDKTTRPVKNDKTTITVNVAISLYHILDTNEKEQTFTCLLAIRTRWKDEYLVWDAEEFGNVSTIRVPANMIWTPDLVISNFAGDKFNDYMITNTIVQSDGSILWLYPALIKTYCTLNVKFFPFDSQMCNIVFISWTFSGFELDIKYNKNFSNSVYYVPQNQEWRVDGITAKRHELKYACCEEPYPDVTFTIHMRRGSLFYIVNLIAPCFVIFMISFLGFFLPVESGEKVNLETTILLALVVFLLMVGETMPPTPDAIPILGLFFGCTMLMVTVALIMAVIVTNIYGKKDSFELCPRWLVRLARKFYPKYMKNFPDDHTEELHPVKRWRDPSINGGARPSEIMSITECQHDDDSDNVNTSTCCGCTCPKVSDNSRDFFPARDFRQDMVARDRQKRFVTSHPPSFDHERNDAEWRMVAKFVDRVLFYVYLVLSMATQAALFTQMVPEPPKDLSNYEDA